MQLSACGSEDGLTVLTLTQNGMHRYAYGRLCFQSACGPSNSMRSGIAGQDQERKRTYEIPGSAAFHIELGRRVCE
jgi:hypothetical protein